MRVFVTGASGFIGSAITRDLIAAGHQVLGLARSKEKAAALAASGAEVLMGSLEDIDPIQRAAAGSDGVIHTAFKHDFTRYVANCEDDRRIIAALGAALDGSDRPLIVTSGTGMVRVASGQASTEDDAAASAKVAPRAASGRGRGRCRCEGRQRVGGAPAAGSRYDASRSHHLRDRGRA